MEGPGDNAIDALDGAIPRGATIGRYTVLSLVGRGGMGEVYAAYDPELDRKVALKFLRVNEGRDPARGHARLLREAKALARVSHRNVVSVHDAGTFDGRVFVAMEFVEGATLRDWLAESLRPRAEILAAFLEAARGLMAAHAAGLVHRDFKPGNVMIAKDGGVRVTDFGLARALGQDVEAGADAPLPSAPNDLATVTAAGQLVGTPRYMAPEQLVDGTVDARSDQFSFCVSLYEALYGEPPFGPGGAGALSAEGRAGRVRPAPPKSTVPAWLRAVLLRGLSVSPAARWPSMGELIVALSGARARTRRRWAAVGAALLSTLCVVAFALHSPTSPALCRGGPARLADAWAAGDTRREAIRRAFLASGAPNASEVWERVPTLLDRYAGRWLAMYEEACLATHESGTQSEATLDLRMSCLDDRRTALAALTNVFMTADRDVVGKAVDAVDSLPEIDRCGNVAALRSAIEPPRDEATRAKVADLRRRIATVKALADAGKVKDAVTLEGPIVNDARASTYVPVLAEALAVNGLFHGGVTDPGITVKLEEAVWTAIKVGRYDLAALSAISRVAAIYYFAPDVHEAPYWIGLARSLLERAGPGHDRLRSWLLHSEASLKERENDFPTGLVLVRQAIALKKRALPKGHPDVAVSLNSEAEFLHALGRDEEALRINAQARATFIAAYGAASSDAAYVASNRGEYLIKLGRPAEALAAFEEGLRGWEPHVGHDSPNLSFPLTGMGRALIALGRAGEAVHPLERALKLRDPKSVNPIYVAETQFALAQALAARGDGPSKAALGLASDARATYQRLDRNAQTAEIDEWLASLRAPNQRR